MAKVIPEGLRSTDIGLFAMRAAQIEKTKPVIAYWCNFHIVNQIIGRGLHNSNDEIKTYTTNLVDKLEQFKSEHSGDELVVDSVAASALVERFGLEVFARAEAAMNANKVTKRRLYFSNYVKSGGALDPEIAGRLKFGKYHAVRIVKAIKNGEDPNATNPVPEEEEQESIANQEVQTFDGSVAEQPSPSRHPPIEEISEESDRLKGRELTQQFSLDESLHTSRASSLQWPPATSNYDIPSVLGDIPGSPARTKEISNPQPGDLELSSSPGTIGYSSPVPSLPDIPGASTFSGADALRYSHTLHPFPPPATSSSIAVPAPTSLHELSGTSSHILHPAAVPSGPPPVLRTSPAHVPIGPPSQPSQSVDEQSISLAQKHAHWALSALAFDDVDTAIKEFKNSLRHLGAAC
ncbi:Vacuolar protein sorting-associate Vta1 N-terminal [Penicillium waksmanii]|uniref:Vacuolar protein sorting-associate Vta1 N-terminal n=1 Tax=Penicillium waksmanii TaxID=69791 RepID=UPI0025495D12|nr:Vacuolar protein sorting-associate Vta1 N-terminal [Penicillium waksmanii]KAJ6001036.1 Vacuolar protein sorting-associate Vta1 N-terminal [Penicillium waksmanii]